MFRSTPRASCLVCVVGLEPTRVLYHPVPSRDRYQLRAYTQFVRFFTLHYTLYHEFSNLSRTFYVAGYGTYSSNSCVTASISVCSLLCTRIVVRAGVEPLSGCSTVIITPFGTNVKVAVADNSVSSLISTLRGLFDLKLDPVNLCGDLLYVSFNQFRRFQRSSQCSKHVKML